MFLPPERSSIDFLIIISTIQKFRLVKGIWLEFAQLAESRKRSSSIVTHDSQTLLVVGGKNERDVDLKTVEMVTLGKSVPGPEMPMARSWGCFVRINSTTSMLLGKG